MSRVRVHNFALSLDHYAAGRGQSVNVPLGLGGMQLHEWALATRSFQQHLSADYRAELGLDGGTRGGVDDEMFARSLNGIGATIMARSLFGPVRGRGATATGMDGGATSRCSGTRVRPDPP